MDKVTLFLKSEKGFKTFRSILERFGSSVIDFIVVDEDKKVLFDYTEQIIELSLQNNVLVFNRKDIYTINTEYSIAISWPWMIKLESTSRLITLHDSLLPKYRGFAPLVNQLINKESVIGVSAILATDDYDCGDILFQGKTEIDYPMKISEAINIISILYQEISLKVIEHIIKRKSFTLVSQIHEEASYSLWRDELDYKIDWCANAADIVRFVNSVGFPYKGASSEIFDRKIRVYEAEVFEDVEIVNRDCGKVIFMKDDRPVVVCRTGLIKITNAIYEDNGLSIFPLNKFRSRFL